MSRLPEKTAVFTDFDGTISTIDVAEAILERYTGKGWWKVEEEYRTGAIGSREAIVRQFHLIETPPDELFEFVDSIKIDPHFKEFVEVCRRLAR